jgi:hypothetical protein
MARSNCPKCENTMVSTANPLHRIFGDVRAFECTQCGYMMLEYYLEPDRVQRRQFGGRRNDARAARDVRLQPITPISPPLFNFEHCHDFAGGTGYRGADLF